MLEEAQEAECKCTWRQAETACNRLDGTDTALVQIQAHISLFRLAKERVQFCLSGWLDPVCSRFQCSEQQQKQLTHWSGSIWPRTDHLQDRVDVCILESLRSNL